MHIILIIFCNDYFSNLEFGSIFYIRKKWIKKH